MLTSLTAAYPVPDFGKKSLDVQLYESPADQIRLESLNLTWWNDISMNRLQPEANA